LCTNRLTNPPVTIPTPPRARNTVQ
jgi:hypothetical protein